MEGPMGLKMSEQEVADYMTSLLQGKAKVAGLEAECLSEWKAVTEGLAKGQEALTRAKAEVERLTATLQQMHGARQALVRMLIAAEEGRRNAANPGLEIVKDLPKGGTVVSSKKAEA